MKLDPDRTGSFRWDILQGRIRVIWGPEPEHPQSESQNPVLKETSSKELLERNHQEALINVQSDLMETDLQDRRGPDDGGPGDGGPGDGGSDDRRW